MTDQPPTSPAAQPGQAQEPHVRPRILIWAEREPDGEIIRYVADLCDAWAGAADPAVWIEPDETPTIRRSIGPVPCSDRIPFKRFARARAVHALREQRPDLLLFAGARAAWHGIACARQAGFRNTAFLALTDEIYRDTSLCRVACTYRSQHTIATNVRCVIVPSLGMRYQYLLRDWIPDDRILVLPKRHDPTTIKPEDRARVRQQLGAVNGDCLVAYIGAFAPRARLDWLLRSWALVEERRAPARLALVGVGPEEVALRTLAGRLGLERCGFHPPDSPPEQVAAAADIVAMSSLYELHSRLPLWAMGAGRPIVAFEADGIRMSFSDGVEGLLAHTGQIQMLAESMCALINDPAGRMRMGERGLLRIAEFGADRHRAKALHVLARLLEDCRA